MPDPSMMPPPIPPPFNDVDTGCDVEYITAAMRRRDLGRAEPRVVGRKAGRRSGGECYERSRSHTCDAWATQRGMRGGNVTTCCGRWSWS